MRVALFQPDIPQNAGAVLRLAACLGVGVDIIEPSGFVWSDRRMKRAGMDYVENVDLVRHTSWDTFRAQFNGRLVLLTTQGATSHVGYRFEQTDTLLLGRESAGVPPDVHDAANARIRVPMADGMRSLNVALAAAMVLSEALRQTDGFANNQPKPHD